jgi:signal transduction histidine kinase
MTNKILKNRSFLLAALTLLGSLIVFSIYFKPSQQKQIANFQHQLIKKQEKLSSSLNQMESLIVREDTLESIWEKTRIFRRKGFVYAVFKNDSLLFWTSNSVPLKSIETSKDSIGVSLFENGWYYHDARAKENLQIYGAFLIKNEYPYQNESLNNLFHQDFDFPFSATISNLSDKHDVLGKDGEFLFSLSNLSVLPQPLAIQFLVYAFFVTGIILLLHGLFLQLFGPKSSGMPSLLIAPALLIVFLLRWWSMKYHWFGVFETFDLFDPQVFASSVLFPTFGDLLFNVLLIFFASNQLTRIKLTEHDFSLSTNKVIGISSLLIFLIVSYLFSESLYHLVLDSDIPLSLHRFMELDLYSFVFIVLVGLVAWSYFILSKRLMHLFASAGLKATTIGLLWFVFGLAHFLFTLITDVHFFGSTILPIAFGALILLLKPWGKKKQSFQYVVLVLAVLSGYIALHVYDTIGLKEKEKLEVYATKLISDKDLNTEIEYNQLAAAFKNHPLVLSIFEEQESVDLSDIKKNLESRFFSNYWNRYEVDFFFYDANFNPIASYASLQEGNLSRLQGIIANSSEQSELNPALYYVTDYSDKLSYIIKQPVSTEQDSLIGYVFCTLKSKIIPQEIGFPRLLLNEESRVFFPLENYSMAKYVGGRLVSRYGAFNYPLTKNAFLADFKTNTGYVNDQSFGHFILNGEYNRTVVLSKTSAEFTQKLTAFSLLFTLFGFLILLSSVFSGKLVPDLSRIKLAFKIQLVLISLVFFSLLFLSIGTGSFVKEQYREYRDGLIREKLGSVNMELIQKLGFEKELNRAKMGSYLEYLLQKFSNVFMTDINLYGLKGNLLASSRSEIYNLGLISEQMKPRAFRNVGFKKKSVYIHEETIGTLRYLSAYIPLQNNEDEVIAYINLPYFAKQNEFESEIAGFLSAIINIFVLLLALSVVVSIFITNRITEPLKRIQASIAELRLGKSSSPIVYRGNDEIGALVKEYNTKLKELEENTVKLAQTEREVAWREMAKQVAHEIKNPLTPMKLRLQHLQRAFDPNDPDAKERLSNVAESIIEQIDALTIIANEFSNFAKLPKPNEQYIDLNSVIKSVATTFADSDNVVIETQLAEDAAMVFADKDLMIRVFNNLVKNAVQAIPVERKGKILIKVTNNNGIIHAFVRDNGSGVPEEMNDKIFAPNFTTKSTGMGLGLAMVKQIIESHNGHISFESDENGSTFSIELKEAISQ